MVAMDERPAMLSAATAVREMLSPRRCDNEAVSCCLRCNALYLALSVERLLVHEPDDSPRARAVAFIAASFDREVAAAPANGRAFSEMEGLILRERYGPYVADLIVDTAAATARAFEEQSK